MKTAIAFAMGALAAVVGLSLRSSDSGAPSSDSELSRERTVAESRPVVGLGGTRPGLAEAITEAAMRGDPRVSHGIDVEFAGLLDAIEKVESGGRVDAIGDGGRSVGSLQIMRAYWIDAVEHSTRHGDRWKLAGGTYPESVRDPAYARRCVLAYADRYGARTPEEIARCHNAGPRWREKAHLTRGYVAKVMKEMLCRR